MNALTILRPLTTLRIWPSVMTPPFRSFYYLNGTYPGGIHQTHASGHVCKKQTLVYVSLSIYHNKQHVKVEQISCYRRLCKGYLLLGRRGCRLDVVAG